MYPVEKEVDAVCMAMARVIPPLLDTPQTEMQTSACLHPWQSECNQTGSQPDDVPSEP